MTDTPITGRLNIEVAPSHESNHGVCLVFQIVNEKGHVLLEKGRSAMVSTPACVYHALNGHFATLCDESRDVLVSNIAAPTFLKVERALHLSPTIKG